MPIVSDNDTMHDNQLLTLLIKKKNNEITPAEEQVLQELLQSFDADEAHAAVELLFNAKVDVAVQEATVNASLHRVLDRITTPRKKLYYMKYAAVAAAVILAFSLGWWYWQKPVEPPLHTLATKKDLKSHLVLPDGTRVIVNGNSKLSYPRSYNQQLREVYLEGEAFFDVVKDSLRPFIVHTSTIDIKVLGTAFNVRAYSGEENTETTLIRGSVDISLKKQGNKVIRLRPNEKVVVKNKDTAAIALERVKPIGKDSALVETKWKQSRIVFEQERLADLIPQLEQWFNVRIHVADTRLLNRRFSGQFEHESLEEVLEVFSMVAGFGYRLDKNNVTIFRKTNK